MMNSLTLAARLNARQSTMPYDEARLCYLKRHRRHLVETLHQQQEKLSCLDYMIFTLERHSKGREIV
mgnify:CR=1 FL=1